MRGPGGDHADRGRAARRRHGRRPRLNPHLRSLALECAEAWSLRLGQPFDGQWSYVVEAELPDGGEAVLKVNLRERETEHEADALRAWDGRGAVRLLDHDPERWALLIERCRPGRQLWELADDEATEIAAEVLEQLWIPAQDPFRRLEDEAERWVEELSASDVPSAARAVSFLREAGPAQRESVLLHQDLHGRNVLESDRGWLAIDAKPLVGEREFDVASLIRDRRPTTKAAMERRLAALVERLELDPERTLGWAIAHALAWDLPEVAELLAS